MSPEDFQPRQFSRVLPRLRTRDELYSHLTGPDHPEIAEPSDMRVSYLRSLHDSLHVEGPSEHSIAGLHYVAPATVLTHAHEKGRRR